VGENFHGLLAQARRVGATRGTRARMILLELRRAGRAAHTRTSGWGLGLGWWLALVHGRYRNLGPQGGVGVSRFLVWLRGRSFCRGARGSSIRDGFQTRDKAVRAAGREASGTGRYTWASIEATREVG